MDVTPDENGRRILAIFGRFNAKEGEVLLANNFVSVGARHRWSMRELQQGLDVAADRGWIEKAQRGWRLTSRGFREMASQNERA